MPAVLATLDYLQNLPLYEHEKPYSGFRPPGDGFDPDVDRFDNLEFEERSNIRIENMRDSETKFLIDECGFEVVPHQSKILHFEERDDINQYKAETEQLLKNSLQAVYVRCYDFVHRKNVTFERDTIDLNDPTRLEGPAKGVHNDITSDSGPAAFERILTREEKVKYYRPGYRFRIINTWRTLVPELEDRPLALCDARSVDRDHLLASDRVLPDRVGEVYYLTYNPNHKWYWLEKQTSTELLAFVMYDTKSGPHARFCPHVSFNNPRAPKNASPRESVETRSVIITKE